MVELHDIYKSYGSLRVLDDINLTIHDGEIMAIVGPSGAGKTSLVQVAGTLDAADSGTVLYDGVDLTRLRDRRLSEFRNANIGFIFQFHQLLPEFSALENAALPAMIGSASRQKAMARAGELFEMLGISDRATHKPAQLSGGERQRVAIARSLVNRPKIVFADEPTGSLDSANRDEILALMAELNRSLGQTFVIVTHDPALAAIAQRVVTMRDGRITSVEDARSGSGNDEQGGASDE
ncbi:MAG TPA: lipoprotein-releasing system ATP-binding protein LolD [Porphyromonadaceae bacterium]|nr:lipoprotein-releasing system ATP-binding protein LolD [Porphyromonadaceae bacterium]